MSDWLQTSLGEICEMRRGISYTGPEVRGDGGIPFLTIKAFEKGGGFCSSGLKYYSGIDVPSHRLRAGDLLIANTDVTRDADIIGAPILVPDLDDSPLFSMDVNQLMVDETHACKSFLFYLLRSNRVRSFMKAHSAGSTVLHLSVKDVPNLPVDLPAVDQQRLIAQILDTLDAQIRQTEALIAKLETVKQGLLTDLLTRGVDENGQLRPPPEEAPELYAKSPLGMVPRGWGVERADQWCCSVADGTHDSPSPASSGCPLVTSKNLKPDGLDLSSSYLISESDYSAITTRSWVERGDVLFGMIGTIGNPATISAGQEQIAPKNVGIFRLGGDLDKGEFLRLVLRSKFVMRQIDMSMLGSTQKFVGLGRLRSLLLPIPPRDEMRSIVGALERFDRWLTQERADYVKLLAEKKGVMEDLLTGRVRVTPLLGTVKTSETTCP